MPVPSSSCQPTPGRTAVPLTVQLALAKARGRRPQCHSLSHLLPCFSDCVVFGLTCVYSTRTSGEMPTAAGTTSLRRLMVRPRWPAACLSCTACQRRRCRSQCQCVPRVLRSLCVRTRWTTACQPSLIVFSSARRGSGPTCRNAWQPARWNGPTLVDLPRLARLSRARCSPLPWPTRATLPSLASFATTTCSPCRSSSSSVPTWGTNSRPPTLRLAGTFTQTKLRNMPTASATAC
mmetsp:Transcript_12774/g.40362  ORF Transcript_12774/g.40362 Transcript_12774/m.40362 type:complete len:235 (-) Transcript_12774:556-1260(-)